MGFLDGIEGMAEQAMEQRMGGNAGTQGVSPEDQSKVAGGFVQALQEHPGGLGGLIEHMRNNGMDQHVQNWTQGNTTPTTPEQVQSGVGGTGLIEQAAAKAGVSPETAKIALAVVLPIIMAHMAPNGQAAPQGQLGGMLGGVLSRIL